MRSEPLRASEILRDGSSHQLEYWIPAEELTAFNNAIVGPIEVVRSFGDAPPPPAE